MKLHEDQLDMISDIQNHIRNKMIEIRNSDDLSEEDLKLWLVNIKKEISNVKDSSAFELSVSKDPELMKEASDVLVAGMVCNMSPERLVEVEPKVEASSLLAEISRGLDVHYDCQATFKSTLVLIYTNILNPISTGVLGLTMSTMDIL